MKYCYLFAITLLLFGTAFYKPARGQLLNTFNYNIDNGMPSNWVYGVLKDRHGYLWIATDKGVVRYNGYEFKLFNVSDGMSNEDIWELFEDKKGKIWLGNISDEFGYIYNNKYHKAFLKGVKYTVYPRRISGLGNGIIFISNYISGDGTFNVCIENDDTIYKFGVQDIIAGKFGPSINLKNSYPAVLIDDNGQPIVITKKFVYKITVNTSGFNITHLMNLNDSVSNEIIQNFNAYFDQYIVSYNINQKKSNVMYVIDLRSHTVKEIDLSKLLVDDYINHVCLDRQDKKFYIIANKKILKFEYPDNVIGYSGIFDLKNYINSDEVNESKIRTIYKDKFWGNCIGTITNGLFVNYQTKNNFNKEDKIGLKDYKNVGGKTDLASFWWNATSSTLARIDNNLGVTYFQPKLLSRVFNIIPYGSNDSFFVSAIGPFLFINNDKGTVLDDNLNIFTSNMYATIIDSPGNFFCISASGFFKVSTNKSRDHYSKSLYDQDRYRGLVYDSLRENYWSYNFDKVFIHQKKNDKDTLITKEKLSDFGVQKIEKIAVDNKFGNIFFKGNTNVTVYDFDRNVFKEVFNNLNLKEATAFIYRNTYIVAGRFGVLFSKILGPMLLSEPLLYHNIKNRNYNFVYGCDAINGKLILSTDKGTYSIIIPSDSEILKSKPDSIFSQIKFIVNYSDTISNFKPGDTLTLSQKNLRLLFDVINPFGNGHIKYAYKSAEDSAWHDLNSGELTLPHSLVPDKYYTLAIRAYDNVWRSDKINLYIYIRPNWYQTLPGRRIVFASIILLVVVFFLGAILITRRMVLVANRKRNLRLELELKSIYAQINPHFIFNTLNSALLLVGKNKTEEAYAHISKFSRLLRAYIKSSRNKLISIADEINNLKDYIELQQTRFKNKFDYQVVVKDNINAADIMIPSLLLQPFVENAISHGILLKRDTGHISINFGAPHEHEILCVIEDDGIGRKKSESLNEKNDKREGSYGDVMIKDLVSIFNKFEEMTIKIEIEDKEEPLTGTIVKIQIKYPHHAK